MTNASVLVLGTRFIKGWDGDVEELQNITFNEQVPFHEALKKRYTTDAHFVLYSIPGEDASPRLNKTSLRAFELGRRRDASFAGYPRLEAVAVDVDLPDHGIPYNWQNTAQWPLHVQQWGAQVQHAISNTPELQTAVLYYTKGGMRFVWELEPSRRISVDFAESYLAQFRDYLQACGLPLDQSCKDWTRLFRLPFVNRQNEGPQNLPFHDEYARPLNWSAPRPLVNLGPMGKGVPARSELPAFADITKPKVGDFTPLKDKDYYWMLRSELPLATIGQRHDYALSVAASICATLKSNDPLVPFRLMMSSAEKADFSMDELWGICLWVATIQAGTDEILKEMEVSLRQEVSRSMGCLPEQVTERLILASRRSDTYYVYDETMLTYQRPTSNVKMLPNRFQKVEQLAFVPPTAGLPVILQHHATPFSRTVVSYIRQETTYEPQTETVYEPACPIDPRLTPSFDPEIDQWLRLLATPDHVDHLYDWLATFLRLDRSTCALYIRGDQGVGKGMFAAGLARLFNTVPVPYDELTQNFQEALFQCPLIWADEKVPQDSHRENDSTIFRKIVGTDQFKVRRKFLDPADLEGSPRILITANNADALRIREALEPEDIEAIQRRIGYIDTTTAPREYLEARARAHGLPLRELTERWVGGGAIAQQILHLRETRAVAVGDRFLVEGWPSALTANLAIKFGLVPLVGTFIIRVLRDKIRTPAVKYGPNDKGKAEVWANTDFISEKWESVMGKASKPPGTQALMKALKVLLDLDDAEPRRKKRPQQGQSPRWYWKISLSRLIHIAEEYYLTDAETILTTALLGTEPLIVEGATPAAILSAAASKRSAQEAK